jgi:hypothetical protein
MVEYHDNAENFLITSDVDGIWVIAKRICPSCRKANLTLQNGAQPTYTQTNPPRFNALHQVNSETLVKPKGSNRPPCPPEVPKKFAGDYSEGCVVLPDSPKASAALGRRCLQNLLREIAGVKPGNLADEIQQVINSGKLPSDLGESIDAIRNVGNFAAHPMKSQHSGEVLDVEAGEAEWILDVLEALFDFYFVRPAKLQQRRAALNQKLAEAAKPPMK